MMSAGNLDPIADVIILERSAWAAYVRYITGRLKALKPSDFVREADAESTRLFNEWRDARLIRDAMR